MIESGKLPHNAGADVFGGLHERRQTHSRRWMFKSHMDSVLSGTRLPAPVIRLCARFLSLGNPARDGSSRYFTHEVQFASVNRLQTVTEFSESNGRRRHEVKRATFAAHYVR